ncbi:hypothetical protein HBI25_048260 [Parastagonospora nodorum]|nr:hypothetical protein HBH51_250930 [Parastagonospora nodorum]KAH4037517.1 hypothetical protein HBI09_071650 [Parastagonospora nodorum]KAH4193199.1 hypothetical protein HBI95_205130 [Parastagonospora nodorum]KAH4250385.1 hypothetical protein HBI03_242250 [Parastagonospora nodorum]KAH4309822.1 hypothetical protein HBI01_031210 [Parastagonospora nodorum]
MTSARNDFGYRKSLSRVLKDMSSEQQNAVKKDRYSDELDVKHSQTQLTSRKCRVRTAVDPNRKGWQ